MALDNIHTRLRFFLNGEEIAAPPEWADIEVLATFDAENPEGQTVGELAQANVTIESFSFAPDAFQAISAWIEAGLGGGLGIFEGVPFQIQAYNSERTLTVFDGLLNLADGLELLPQDGRYIASLEKIDGLNNLAERINGLTYGFLESEGVFGPADYTDLDYIVKKDVDPLQAAFLAVTAYILAKELAESIQRISQNVATALGIASGSITGSIGSAVFNALAAIIELAYSVAILAALIELGKTVAGALLPPLRVHKCIRLGLLVEKVTTYLGLGFESDIDELNSYYYLASNLTPDQGGPLGVIKKAGTITSGIPNANDYGYKVTEIFELVARLFNARFAVVDNVLQLRSENSLYWVREASYKLPSVLIENVRYNTGELKANRILAFDTDVRDDFTITNFTGTNYEVITTPINTQGEKFNAVRGLEELRFPVCLGTRNNDLSQVEQVLRFVLEQLESLAGVFGSNINLSGVFDRKIGALKVSDNQHAKPKLLALSGAKIASNHRNSLSAKTLYEKYHIYKSFVAGNFNGQKFLYSQEIPFGLEDFNKLTENSYFRTSAGEVAKATAIRWRLGADRASIDYYVRKPYTKNLQEQFIEP